MSPQAQNFTCLEQAVLKAIRKMYPLDSAALETQLATAVFRKRENSGAGFFTYFDVDRKANPVPGQRFRYGPAPVKIKDLQHGMGFILWMKDGYADCLEGYSYDESTTTLSLETVAFEMPI